MQQAATPTQTFTQRFANPTRFMALANRLLPWITVPLSC